MQIDLIDKSALLIGSGGAITTALAAALAENGARLACARFAESGRRLLGSQPDVAPVEISANSAQGLAPFGEPWLLVAVHPNVEPLSADGTGSAVVGWDAADLRRLVAAGAPHLKRVVAVISVAGLVPLRSNPVLSAEQASLASVTRSLAMEWGGAGVVVNAVAVGCFGDGEEPVGADLLSHAALKRPARLSEIGAAVLFLADPENTYTTGHIATVDGGFAAGYARNF